MIFFHRVDNKKCNKSLWKYLENNFERFKIDVAHSLDSFFILWEVIAKILWNELKRLWFLSDVRSRFTNVPLDLLHDLFYDFNNSPIDKKIKTLSSSACRNSSSWLKSIWSIMKELLYKGIPSYFALDFIRMFFAVWKINPAVNCLTI